MKRNDLLIVFAALILIALIYFMSNIFKYSSKPMQVVVYSENEVVGTFSLYEDVEKTFVNSYGENTVKIQNMAVSVVDADCDNRVCVNSGEISEIGETIVCLPHRFYVEIVGEKDGEIDAVAK